MVIGVIGGILVSEGHLRPQLQAKSQGHGRPLEVDGAGWVRYGPNPRKSAESSTVKGSGPKATDIQDASFVRRGIESIYSADRAC